MRATWRRHGRRQRHSKCLWKRWAIPSHMLCQILEQREKDGEQVVLETLSRGCLPNECRAPASKSHQIRRWQLEHELETVVECEPQLPSPATINSVEILLAGIQPGPRHSERRPLGQPGD